MPYLRMGKQKVQADTQLCFATYFLLDIQTTSHTYYFDTLTPDPSQKFD